MAPSTKYETNLTDEQRNELLDFVSHGVENARVIRRARTLLLSDEGRTRAEVAEILHVRPATVTKTARDFCEGGLQQALFDNHRKGRPPKVTSRDEARITAIATSEPPEGRAKWTLALIRDEFLVLSELDDISTESIRLVLKKTPSNHGRANTGSSAT